MPLGCSAGSPDLVVMVVEKALAACDWANEEGFRWAKDCCERRALAKGAPVL